MDRLGKKLESLRFIPWDLEQITQISLSRKQNHSAPWAIPLNLDRQVDPRQLRHHDIRNQQIGSLRPRRLQRKKRLREARCVKAPQAQDSSQCRYDEVLIVDKINPALNV